MRNSQLVRPGLKGDEERSRALEEQVQMLTLAATEAIDHAARLENELSLVRSESLKIHPAPHTNQFRQVSVSSYSSHESKSSIDSVFSTAESFDSIATDASDIESCDFDNPKSESKASGTCATKLSLHSSERTVGPREEFMKKCLEITQIQQQEQNERLHRLEVALKAIHQARKTLNSPRMYRYI